MIKEAENQKYIIINNFKVFVGLPIICKKTMTINKTDDIKNNEEFEVTYILINHYYIQVCQEAHKNQILI